MKVILKTRLLIVVPETGADERRGAAGKGGAAYGSPDHNSVFLGPELGNPECYGGMIEPDRHVDLADIEPFARDGRILEELGSYDPMIKNTDERVILKPDRIKHWLSVGALPSERVAIFLKKYMAKFEQAAAMAPQPAAPT